MPMDRTLYPDNWTEIASAIKNEVNWICEACGKQCIKPGESPLDFCDRIATARLSECLVIQDYLAYPRRYHLTVAHLDHMPEHCDRTNLRAWCNPCHCRYDLKAMPTKRRLKAERSGQLTLPIG
jgi:hypothetical protein